MHLEFHNENVDRLSQHLFYSKLHYIYSMLIMTSGTFSDAQKLAELLADAYMTSLSPQPTFERIMISKIHMFILRICNVSGNL